MSERDDDGPAFPKGYGQSDGMTLRDWFAGQALAGLAREVTRVFPDVIAQNAYVYADAMMAERAKDMPTGAAEYDPARLGEMERGQAPDEPAAAGRNDSAAQPAPAPVPHCLNCGLVLGSDRPYCDVCGCGSTCAAIRCHGKKGHDGERHWNGGVSWGSDGDRTPTPRWNGDE